MGCRFSGDLRGFSQKLQAVCGNVKKEGDIHSDIDLSSS